MRSGQMDYAVDGRGLFLGSLNVYVEGNIDSKEQMTDKFLNVASYQYEAGVRDGFIPRAVSEQTFRDVGTKLISAAWANPPNGASIRAISTGECDFSGVVYSSEGFKRAPLLVRKGK